METKRMGSGRLTQYEDGTAIEIDFSVPSRFLSTTRKVK
jgi:hypothetical protein